MQLTNLQCRNAKAKILDCSILVSPKCKLEDTMSLTWNISRKFPCDNTDDISEIMHTVPLVNAGEVHHTFRHLTDNEEYEVTVYINPASMSFGPVSGSFTTKSSECKRIVHISSDRILLSILKFCEQWT